MSWLDQRPAPPVFVAFTCAGDVGLLLLSEPGLVLLGEILGGLFCPTTPPTPTSAACCAPASRWALFACSS